MPEPDISPKQAVTAEVRAQLARKQRSVAELAAHIGISEATLYRRLGDGDWSLDEIASTAKFFEMNFWQFLRLTMRDIAA